MKAVASENAVDASSLLKLLGDDLRQEGPRLIRKRSRKASQPVLTSGVLLADLGLAFDRGDWRRFRSSGESRWRVPTSPWCDSRAHMAAYGLAAGVK